MAVACMAKCESTQIVFVLQTSAFTEIQTAVGKQQYSQVYAGFRFGAM